MQSTEQLCPRALATGVGRHPVEGETRKEGVQENVITSASLSWGEDQPERGKRHHHRRASTAWTFADGDAGTEGEDTSKHGKEPAMHHLPPLSLTPLPTIEAILSSPPASQTHLATATAKSPPSPQPPYKTIIHIPKPPPLRRRNHLDADTLEEILRAADRARARTLASTIPTASTDADTNIKMTDHPSSTSASLHNPFPSFLPQVPTSYPSPPPSPSPSQTQHSPPHKLPSVPVFDLDEMDWEWGDGAVVYGAAGVALSPRAMRERKAGCRCRCRCGGLGLYDIAEESEEEGGDEGVVGEEEGWCV